MPFTKGMKRPAGAGRRKGQRNRINLEVSARLAELGCDPVEGLALIAMDLKAPINVRARCHAELLEYVKPKLSRHEVVGPLGTGGAAGPVQLVVEYVNKPKPE